MIDLRYIRNFYPPLIADNQAFSQLMLKEHLQLMMLNYISTSAYAGNLTFIGGTCLRHVYGIDRFSEDLDFDCKNLTHDNFIKMTDDIVCFLCRSGINAVVRDKDNPRLTAYRRNIYFPELLFHLNLSGHKQARLLIKVEAQDQGVEYVPDVVNINQHGFTFLMSCAPAAVLCSMKIAALLGRGKGRDFYDLMFLSSITRPDFDFLQSRSNIKNVEQLKNELEAVVAHTDLSAKTMDCRHLMIEHGNADKILNFASIIPRLCTPGVKD